MTYFEIRTIRTYVSGTHGLKNRLRVELFSTAEIATDRTVGALSANVLASNIVKIFKRITHTTQDETKRLMRERGKFTEDVEKGIVEVHRTCEFCARSG